MMQTAWTGHEIPGNRESVHQEVSTMQNTEALASCLLTDQDLQHIFLPQKRVRFEQSAPVYKAGHRQMLPRMETKISVQYIAPYN